MRQETIDILRQELANEVGVDVESVRIMERYKENGLKLTGVTIVGGAVSALCYINGYLDDIEADCCTFKDAAQDIARILKKNTVPDEIREEAEKLADMSKEDFLAGIEIRLVNQFGNRELLEEFPHFPWCDLAGVFYYRISAETGVRVSYTLMDAHDVTVPEMMAAGIKNVERGASVQRMGDVLAAMTGERVPEDDMPQMYVMSNKGKYNGANILLTPDPFESLAEKLEDDLFILPSSRHEVLAIPKKIGNVEELNEMVQAVNRTQVSKEDFLSDHVYQYTRGTGVIDMAV